MPFTPEAHGGVGSAGEPVVNPVPDREPAQGQVEVAGGADCESQQIAVREVVDDVVPLARLVAFGVQQMAFRVGEDGPQTSFPVAGDAAHAVADRGLQREGRDHAALAARREKLLDEEDVAACGAGAIADSDIVRADRRGDFMAHLGLG